MNVRVLVCLDDEQESRELAILLSGSDFDVQCLPSGAAVVERCTTSSEPLLVVVGDELSDVAGMEVCRRLRQSSSVRSIPVVMLSPRGEDIDRVVAFELGADDYITKPFDPREVVLRLRAILRRCYPSEVSSSPLEAGLLRLDRESHRVWLGDAALALTRVEFALLEVLMLRRGRAQPRARLLEDVWGRGADANSRTVDTHIRRLRAKLGRAGSHIHTVRGVGYRFGEASELD